MKDQKAISNAVIPLFLVVFVTVLLVAAPAWGDWQKMYPVPDVDKAEHQHWAHSTCWVAVAANMLAAAGYGEGQNVQERANEIYDELCSDPNIDPNVIKCCNPRRAGNICYGWADTAMREWLRSPCNKWKQNNPYKIVTVHGPPNCKDDRDPWQKPDLPKFIANELRKCSFVRLSIIKPDKTCGHAITAWGDSQGSGLLAENPNDVKVSDSDYQNITQNIQTYTYDDYNDSNGWYINYNYSEDVHRYIDNIVTLSVTGYDMSKVILGGSKKFVGSYKIHQDRNDANALGLHYKVLSGSILTYRTTIDWDNNDVPPTIAEDNDPPDELAVNWDLTDNPVPYCNDVTITTELVLPWQWGTGIFNPITYADVNFSYVDLTIGKPSVGWRMTTPDKTPEPNATGGYVIGAFNIYDHPDGGEEHIIVEYRLIYEYGYDQNPEYHEFYLEGEPPTLFVGSFRFGHSYGFLDDDELWQFSGPWWTEAYPPPYEPLPPLGPLGPITISWPGQLLPYPNPLNYAPPEPEKCGDPGTYYVSGDINKDCYVDFFDFAEFTATWLQCTDPCDANCW